MNRLREGHIKACRHFCTSYSRQIIIIDFYSPAAVLTKDSNFLRHHGILHLLMRPDIYPIWCLLVQLSDYRVYQDLTTTCGLRIVE